jgi:hypothetical protein
MYSEPDLFPEHTALLRTLVDALGKHPEVEAFDLWQILTGQGNLAWIQHPGLDGRLNVSPTAVDSLASEGLIRLVPEGRDLTRLSIRPAGVRYVRSGSAARVSQELAVGGEGQPTVAVDATLCFVLMSFDPALSEVWEDAIHKSVADYGMQCIRADQVYGPGVIMNDIVANIKRARLLIADLTNRNPNVFYELGWAHSLDKEVILLSQTMDDVPFDIRHRRIILYTTTGRGLQKLRAEIQNHLRAIMERP